jgi:hypothetical protein
LQADEAREAHFRRDALEREEKAGGGANGDEDGQVASGIGKR